MSCCPDDGAVVMRWKKAIEARRTKLSYLKECCFFKASIFSFFEHIVQI